MHGYRGLFQCRSELEISCEGYRRSCRVAIARVRTRRHTTLPAEPGAFTDRICDAPLSFGGRQDSLPSTQDYKPARKHFVIIFSAQPRARFNSRWACPAVDLTVGKPETGVWPITSGLPVICPQSAACSKSTFLILTTKLRRDVKESEKYAGIDWLRHKVQYHGNSSVRCTPYHTWVLTANS